MRILAVDPGYDRLGVAIMEKRLRGKEELLYSECFSPSKDFTKERRILEAILSIISPAFMNLVI